MRTTIDIDDRLMATAQQLTKIKNKKVLIDNALRLYVTCKESSQIKNTCGEKLKLTKINDLKY